MSIRAVILDCVQSGQLIHLPPLDDQMSIVREVYVFEDLVQLFDGPWEDEEDERAAARLRFDLDSFTSGDRIIFGEKPYSKPNDCLIAPIDPVGDAVFSIRNRTKPATRILGAFADMDLFVALVWEYRRNLDGPNGPLWRSFRERAKAKWAQCFHGFQRLNGGPYDLASNIRVDKDL